MQNFFIWMKILLKNLKLFFKNFKKIELKNKKKKKIITKLMKKNMNQLKRINNQNNQILNL